MTLYLVYLCGHYLNLAFEEVKACLDAEMISYEIVENHHQILIFKSSDNPSIAINRCAMVHSYYKYMAEGIVDEVVQITNVAKPQLPINFSFHVRVKKLGLKTTKLRSPEIERFIASYLFDTYSEHNLTVNLESADFLFKGFIVENKLFLGLEIQKLDRSKLFTRDPGKKPIFRPGAMKTEFARALVNLSRTKSGDIFYDPFCGVGGCLTEAKLIGAYSLGSDLDFYALRGSKNNLKTDLNTNYDLFQGDSRFISLKNVDAIATDPPYSIQSSTHGELIPNLISDFLDNAKTVLKNGSYLVFCLPKRYSPEKIAEDAGYEVVSFIDNRIHKSLTRRVVITVCKNEK